MATPKFSSDISQLNQLGRQTLPGYMGIEFVAVGEGSVENRLAIRPALLAPNGHLHAATVVALADTACGYGTMLNLPDKAKGFTTIELKSNFMGTVREGAIGCRARLVHQGKLTQVWDATVHDEGSRKTMALFRCTQMLLFEHISACLQ